MNITLSESAIARGALDKSLAPRDHVIIFVHLPKCGGTTLNRIIEWEYSPWRIFSIDPSFFLWSYRKLMHWSQRRLDTMQVFKGHMPFGLHSRLSRPSTYITVLRDPIDRCISAYYFALNYKLHPLHKFVKKMTLEEYAVATPNHNVQCKLLAGTTASESDFHAGDCSAETLEVAKENLSRYFSVAGLTERFDESLALLRAVFGWNIEKLASFNTTRNRPNKQKLPPSTISLIRERNRFDMALYEHVSASFNKTCVNNREALNVELQAVRRAKALGSVETMYYTAASEVRKAISRIQSAI
jgi:hypothetical protein